MSFYFVTNFIANYKTYSETPKFYPEYLSQIQDVSKYDIKIINNQLYFRLKDFEISQDLAKNVNSDIKYVTWKKDIVFELTLK